MPNQPLKVFPEGHIKTSGYWYSENYNKFDISNWALVFGVLNRCAKLFWNHTMHKRMTFQTQMCACLRNLQILSMTLTFDEGTHVLHVTKNLHAEHLCQIIWKLFREWQSYSQGRKRMTLMKDGWTERCCNFNITTFGGIKNVSLKVCTPRWFTQCYLNPVIMEHHSKG